MSRRNARIFQDRGLRKRCWSWVRCAGFHLDTVPGAHPPPRHSNKPFPSDDAPSGNKVPLTKPTNWLTAAILLKATARMESMVRNATCASSAIRLMISTPESVAALTSLSDSPVFSRESLITHTVQGLLSACQSNKLQAFSLIFLEWKNLWHSLIQLDCKGLGLKSEIEALRVGVTLRSTQPLFPCRDIVFGLTRWPDECGPRYTPGFE